MSIHGLTVQQEPTFPMWPMDQMHIQSNQTLYLVIIVILLAVIIVLYLRQTRVKPQSIKQEVEKAREEADHVDGPLEVAMRLLDENEKLVVETLVAEGGTMLQKDISYKLDFTRVKTHRTIQSLEKRDIVTTVDHFNTKQVTLADWLK
ncbi:MAG: hypothetical protein NWE89_03795 [Candidatus Bathyarchaeota archaeon]|nr:hypothetical protein [Candidatus Bathyarchaeota archaeon]